jgi:hypothetical protein
MMKSMQRIQISDLTCGEQLMPSVQQVIGMKKPVVGKRNPVMSH